MKISRKRVACITDLHIGVHQNSSVWHNITIDFAKWLKNILDKQGIKDIIICGDINNDRNEISVNSLNVVSQVFKIWEDFKIFIVVGNHDAYYRDRSDVNSLSLLSGWENITIIDKVTSIEAFDNKLSFCPWGTQLKDIENSDIIFAHFDISGFKMTKSKISASGLNSKELLNKSNLIVSGHFHLREERKYQNGTILYLGCPYQLDWGDYGDTKGIYILNLETKKYEFIENDMSPKHKRVKLSELVSLGKITEDIKKDFSGNFINFIVDQNVNSDKIDALINKLSSLKPLSIRTDFNLGDKYNIDETNYEFTGVDIPAAIEEFVNLLDVDNKKDILNYTLDLYKRVS